MIIRNDKITNLQLRIFSLIYVLRYAFQIYYFYTSENKRIIKRELDFQIKEYRVRSANTLLNFIWALNFNPFFVSLFYHRIGASRASLCSWTKKDSASLFFCCQEMGVIKMYHPFSTIINAEKIGDNLIIRNNTTIGNINDDHCLRPTIGDNVTLGAGVIIFGKITVGNNVTIGAGSVINKDIPDNCVVVGNPFRIIKYNNL